MSDVRCVRSDGAATLNCENVASVATTVSTTEAGGAPSRVTGATKAMVESESSMWPDARCGGAASPVTISALR